MSRNCSISNDSMDLFKETWFRFPDREVSGKFSLSDDNDTCIVFDAILTQYGDSANTPLEKSVYTWHTHPLTADGIPESPSGDDFAGSLSYGFPYTNPDKFQTLLDIVVASEGIYLYRKTSLLLASFESMIPIHQYTACKKIRLYINLLNAIFKNGILTVERFLYLVEHIQFDTMARFFRENNEFAIYITREFPHYSMEKVMMWSGSMPGFIMQFISFGLIA